jgi:hypothetical protein
LDKYGAQAIAGTLRRETKRTQKANSYVRGSAQQQYSGGGYKGQSGK